MFALIRAGYHRLKICRRDTPAFVSPYTSREEGSRFFKQRYKKFRILTPSLLIDDGTGEMVIVTIAQKNASLPPFRNAQTALPVLTANCTCAKSWVKVYMMSPGFC